MTYYAIKSLLANVGLPVVLPLLYFRYHTMRYRFDEEGIRMSWGILFRHEIVLNYSRIQDIHLRSSWIERMLGLARIEIQTASGSAGAEMTLEGMANPDEMRDFLYSRMRGARDPHPGVADSAGALEEASAGGLAAILGEVANELRAIRVALEAKPALRGKEGSHA